MSLLLLFKSPAVSGDITTSQTQIGVAKIKYAIHEGPTISTAGIGYGDGTYGVLPYAGHYGRVTVTTTKTQTGISRITVSVSKTQTGVSRIGLVTSNTQTGVSRITASASKTQTGVSRIGLVTSKTQTGISRITVSDRKSVV